MQKLHFKDRVLSVVSKIPKGTTMSYGEVAYAAGYPGAARAVGTLMAHNHNPKVPCHRVIRADGHVGEYNGGGEEMKRTRLLKEGVSFKGSRVMRDIKRGTV
jgi:methylated-DNA-[protein]-cysteine S-methyltransferase